MFGIHVHWRFLLGCLGVCAAGLAVGLTSAAVLVEIDAPVYFVEGAIYTAALGSSAAMAEYIKGRKAVSIEAFDRLTGVENDE